MTHLALTAVINSIAVTGCITVLVCLILRITGRNAWNATTREAVWWIVLAIAVTAPLLYAPSELISGISIIPIRMPSRPTPATASDFRLSVRATSETIDSRKTGPLVETPQNHSLFPIRIVASRWPSWIFETWIAMSLLMLSRLIVSYVQLSRRKSRAAEAPAELSIRVHQWMRPFEKNKRRVRVAVSTEVTGPVATGPFQPCILIPATLSEQLTEAELDQIILHEAAHLGRRDDYRLLVQRIVEALFVFHPLVRWITRRIDLEREIACDDFVINTLGGSGRYALCLTRLMEISGGIRESVLGASAAERPSHLESRVDMLLNDNRQSSRGVLKTRLAGVLTALALVTFTAAKLPAMLVLVKPVVTKPIKVTEKRLSPRVLPSQPSPIRAAARAGQPVISSAKQAPGISVTVAVRVTDRLGRYVSGLEKNHFRVREDGVEQQISEFLPNPWLQSGAVSIVIVFNGSGGTGSGAIPQEALRLLTTGNDPADEFALIRFDLGPQLSVGFTRNVDEIQRGFTATSTNQGLLLDGVRMAVEETRMAQNPRKAIVIVSENGPDAALYNEMETRAVAAAADAPIYSLSAFPSAATVALLDDLARNTGGRHFRISDVADLGQSSDVVNKIAVAIRNFYVLTFQSSNNVRDGRYRMIEVELLPPRGIQSLYSDYRAGYFAPGQQRN